MSENMTPELTLNPTEADVAVPELTLDPTAVAEAPQEKQVEPVALDDKLLTEQEKKGQSYEDYISRELKRSECLV